jgi:formate/nitrite transporter FocA (FNT family)
LLSQALRERPSFTHALTPKRIIVLCEQTWAPKVSFGIGKPAGSERNLRRSPAFIIGTGRDMIMVQLDTPEQEQDSIGTPATQLTESEKREAREHTALRAAVIHEAIRTEGEAELKRPTTALVWSGIAAGLSMGFSLATMGLLYSRLPDTQWRTLVTDLGYTVGFLAVILGRQHLYTENTLTVMIPLLTNRDGRTLRAMLHLWGIVLAANLIGAGVVAWIIATTNVFDPEVRAAMVHVASLTVAGTWSSVMIRALFAGWIIATMVWMMPASDTSRPAIIIIMTYLVALGEFPHVVVSSVDGVYLVAAGTISWGKFLEFLVPTAIGNTIGGVLLVAFFNHAQVISES